MMGFVMADLVYMIGFVFTFVMMVIGFSAYWAWQERKNKNYIVDEDDVAFKLVVPFGVLSFACIFWPLVLPLFLIVGVSVLVVKFVKSKFVQVFAFFDKFDGVKEKFDKAFDNNGGRE